MWNRIGRPRPPAVDEIKIFDNNDRATKHSERKERFSPLSSLSKNLISSTAGGLGSPIQFYIFSSRPFVSSWPLLFHTRGVLVEIIALLTSKKIIMKLMHWQSNKFQIFVSMWKHAKSTCFVYVRLKFLNHF